MGKAGDGGHNSEVINNEARIPKTTIFPVSASAVPPLKNIPNVAVIYHPIGWNTASNGRLKDVEKLVLMPLFPAPYKMPLNALT